MRRKAAQDGPKLVMMGWDGVRQRFAMLLLLLLRDVANAKWLGPFGGVAGKHQVD